METVKNLLLKECDYPVSGEIIDKLLDGMEEIPLKPNDILIMSGKVDGNIYVVKEGVVRYSYMNGLREMTFAFALPGTMIMSMFSYYFHQPTFYQIEACCESVAVKITKQKFDSLVAESHDFAQWALRMAYGQLCFFEMKNCVINGDAKERFLSLVKNRPEIMEKVPLKFVASYLGITQSYLSRLKKQLLPK